MGGERVMFRLILLCLAVSLTATAEPEKRKPMNTISSPEELKSQVDNHVSLSGIALDAKAGAVVKLSAGTVYIRNLSSWPDNLVGRKVIVKGMLRRKKIMPDPLTNENGLTVQGAFGQHYILDNPNWRLAEN
jgi:hypothetical protein